MNWATSLRRAISYWAKQYAEHRGIPYYLSLGQHPTVMFKPYNGNTLHGNFLSPSYKAILDHPPWKSRLNKAHPQSRSLPPEERSTAKELDSSNSSDALLMNVFCHPEVKDCTDLMLLFGLSSFQCPEFGVPGCVPLIKGKVDSTEIDMRTDDIIIEAKLTESDFTKKTKDRIEAYRDFEEVFEASALPQDNDKYFNYQLIRNVLAAYAQDASYFLICDARRPDLLKSWGDVMSCIKPMALRIRCHFVLWQEIAAVSPDEIRDFLKDKYGIANAKDGE